MPDGVLRVLSDDVEAVEAAAPGLGDDGLRTLYECMVLVRALDGCCLRLQRAGRIGFYLSSAGQEAASVGAAYAFEEGDWIFPSFRDPGIFLLRGGSLKSYLDQLLGNADDLSKGRQMPNHHSLPDGRYVSVSSPLGTQIAQAVGCAMAMRLQGHRRAVLVCFGEAATAAAHFHSGMEFAAIYRAPVVLLCHSSRWVAEPGRRQRAVAARAAAYGFEGVRVDGTDVLAVYKAVHEARAKALDGAGPTLVEALTRGPWRTPGQEAFGGAAGRQPGEQDPVGRLREYMERRGIWDAAREEELRERSRRRVEEAAQAALAVGPPPAGTLVADVYAEPPWTLREQGEALGAGGGGAGGR